MPAMPTPTPRCGVLPRAYTGTSLKTSRCRRGTSGASPSATLVFYSIWARRVLPCVICRGVVLCMVRFPRQKSITNNTAGRASLWLPRRERWVREPRSISRECAGDAPPGCRVAWVRRGFNRAFQRCKPMRPRLHLATLRREPLAQTAQARNRSGSQSTPLCSHESICCLFVADGP